MIFCSRISYSIVLEEYQEKCLLRDKLFYCVRGVSGVSLFQLDSYPHYKLCLHTQMTQTSGSSPSGACLVASIPAPSLLLHMVDVLTEESFLSCSIVLGEHHQICYSGISCSIVTKHSYIYSIDLLVSELSLSFDMFGANLGLTCLFKHVSFFESYASFVSCH